MTEANAYQLAQVNIGRLKAPLDSPQLKAFVDNLDPVNADADITMMTKARKTLVGAVTGISEASAR